ncbi:MAG: synthase subunit [Bacteroidota bacterium]|jgi:F-type H+-transporting ATPase subunit a
MNIQVQLFLNQFKSFLLVLLFVLVTKISVHAEEGHGQVGAEEKFVPSEMIIHHISDSHEWHIATIGHNHITIPLPVILYFEIDGKSGWDFFMSSQFHAEGFDHEGERHESLPVDGGFKLDHHGHIFYEKDGKPFGPAKIIDLSITKNAASIMLSFVLLLFVFLSVAKGFSKNKGKAPSGIQSFFEPLIVFVRDEIALPNIGEHKYMKFMPYLLTVFFFIWFNNLLGLVPSGANATGNIAVTLTLALLTAIITNVSGNKEYWMHILWTPGVPLPLRIIMLPVELLGIITKPFALMIRLFANITAGHCIILSIMSFIFIFKSLSVAAVSVPFAMVMNVMEFGVAALQAYIFTLLSALFIGSAVAEHAHDDHH